MGEFTAPVADHDVGFARHCRVGGGLGEHGAENGIVTFGGNAADGVAEVEVFGIDLNIANCSTG